MDIEKLIEDLHGILKQYGEKIPYGELVGAPWPYSRAGDLVWPDPEPYFIEQAATALSTLQAENEKLRAELEQVKEERDCAHYIQAQRWIPVTERLPEADRTFTHDKSVLVYVPENKKMLHHGIYEGKLVTDEIDGERVTDWLLWGWPYIDRERPFVTHWMPLPEPPEVSE